MINHDDRERGPRAELMGQLRTALRVSRQLAEQLSGDPLVGHEVRALLGRLEAIRAEMQDIQASAPDVRRADNDPIWTQFRSTHH